MDGVAAAAQCVAVERVGRGLVVRQRLVVVRWRDGRPQGGLAVMVWSSWGKIIEKPFYQAVNQLSISNVQNCVKRCRKCERNNSTEGEVQSE